jgi:hypothetical protein
MPFCGGGDLEKMIAKLDYRYGAPLSEEKLMRMVISLSLGLGVLHKNKILHRDIKAENAIFDANGILKISFLFFFLIPSYFVFFFFFFQKWILVLEGRLNKLWGWHPH